MFIGIEDFGFIEPVSDLLKNDGCIEFFHNKYYTSKVGGWQGPRFN